MLSTFKTPIGSRRAQYFIESAWGRGKENKVGIHSPSSALAMHANLLQSKRPTGAWKDVSVCSSFNQGLPLTRGVQKEWILSRELKAKTERLLWLWIVHWKKPFSRIVHVGGEQKKNPMPTPCCLQVLQRRGLLLKPIISFHCLSKCIKLQSLLLYKLFCWATDEDFSYSNTALATEPKELTELLCKDSGLLCFQIW